MSTSTLDFTGERMAIGDTTEFVTKMNTLQTKLEAYSAELNTLSNNLGIIPVLTGKNFLINSDKRISQRGDYSSATGITTNTYYIDRFKAVLSGVTANITHVALNATTHTKTLKYAATSTASGKIEHTQTLESDVAYRLRGSEVTFTAEVKADFAAQIAIYDGVTTTYSSKHTGGGAFENLTVTATLDASATTLVTTVAAFDDGASISITSGDYFEVGREELEIGDTFAGFEIQHPSIELLKCLRFYEKSYNNDRYIGAGRINSSTGAQGIAVRYGVRKRTTPTVVLYDYTGTSGKLSVSGGTPGEYACLIDRSSSHGFGVYTTALSGETIGQAYYLSGGYTADAEIY